MGRQFEFDLKSDDDVLSPQPLPGMELLHPLPVLIEAAGHARAKPVAVKAQAPLLPRGVVAEDAFRITLLQCKWHIAANVPAVVEAQDPEGIHQMRVGLRRLRVALTSFGGDFRSPALETLRMRARKMAARMGPARDLDVFGAELLEPAAQAASSARGFDVLRARAAQARHTAWNFAVAHVAGAGFASFMSELGEAVDRRVWFEASGRGKITKGRFVFEMPAADLATRMLDHRLKHARKRAKHLNELSDEQRHRLRIALKKLRYTSEFFAPLYEANGAHTFQKNLSRMQDTLGCLNDVAVARKTLHSIVEGPAHEAQAVRPELAFAAGAVYGFHLDRAEHTWKKVKNRWKTFAKTEPYWRSGVLH
ncbi:MAG TPA: CHAD domain-containing protein [Rhizomicrobium sp.]|jgi:CHAD domain-containing protein|nr:CHAD domain-containing protein [Rhizomicrobium sp.]